MSLFLCVCVLFYFPQRTCKVICVTGSHSQPSFNCRTKLHGDPPWSAKTCSILVSKRCSSDVIGLKRGAVSSKLQRSCVCARHAALCDRCSPSIGTILCNMQSEIVLKSEEDRQLVKMLPRHALGRRLTRQETINLMRRTVPGRGNCINWLWLVCRNTWWQFSSLLHFPALYKPLDSLLLTVSERDVFSYFTLVL